MLRGQVTAFSDGDDSDVEDVLLVLTVLRHMGLDRPNPRGDRRVNRLRGMEISEDVFSSDATCMNLCRMSRRCLRILIQRFVDVYEVRANGFRIPVEEQVIMSVHYLAHAGTMSGTGTLFGRSKNGASRVLKRMLQPLVRLFRDELIPVDQNIIHPKLRKTPLRSVFQVRVIVFRTLVMTSDNSMHVFIQGCIGAVDGTHVNVYPPAHESLQWRGRSGATTTNCLGICDHDMLFTYFYVGCQGSFHDARVLREAESRPANRFPTPLPGILIRREVREKYEPNPPTSTGKYYLGDSGYANRVGFLTPFRRTRYHPSQFDGRRPSNRNEMFNKQHSSLRSVIERTFGIWKNKWHIVHYTGALQGFKLKKQLAIIKATVGLHNFVRRNRTEREMDEEDINVDQQTPYTAEDEVDMDEENEARRRDDMPMERFRDVLADLVYNECQNA